MMKPRPEMHPGHKSEAQRVAESGSVDDVFAWVGTDAQRASEARSEEARCWYHDDNGAIKQREPRQDLLRSLQLIADGRASEVYG